MARIIGLDLGSVTCGVAISDATGLVARTLKTIRFPSEDYDICFDEVLDLLEKNQVKKVVLGLPKHMNGDIGTRAEISIQFAKELKKEGYDVTLWDERLTTVSATRILLEGDVSRKKRKKIIDQLAAVEILQGYLDQQNGGV